MIVLYELFTLSSGEMLLRGVMVAGVSPTSRRQGAELFLMGNRNGARGQIDLGIWSCKRRASSRRPLLSGTMESRLVSFPDA